MGSWFQREVGVCCKRFIENRDKAGAFVTSDKEMVEKLVDVTSLVRRMRAEGHEAVDHALD